MRFAATSRSTRCYSIMLFRDFCLVFLEYRIKEVQPRRHSDTGVGIPQKCAYQHWSQDMNPHSNGAYGGAPRPSPKSLQLRGAVLSGCHLLHKTFFRYPWNLFLNTFLCHQFIEITSIFPILLSFSLSILY